LLEEYEVAPELLYPTHVERDEGLMLEAIELSRRGVTVDIDTVEQDLVRWLTFYLENGGKVEHLTVSSDAAINSPRTLYEQLRECVLQTDIPLDRVLPLATRNTARVLGLKSKGSLEVGADADVLLLHKGSLEISGVIAGGRCFVQNGEPRFTPQFVKNSNREVVFHGKKS
jgi:beta-aspartyl-dipeptidase (metallo-type)